jgi:hypothetical protein
MIGANGTSNHIISHCFFSKCTLFWVRLSPATASCEIMLSQNHVLSQTSTFWFVFIQFYCAVSHTEHRWGWSYHWPDSSCWKYGDLQTCDHGFNQFYSIENWEKKSLKKEILISKFHKKKIPKEIPKISKFWQKKHSSKKKEKKKFSRICTDFFFQKHFPIFSSKHKMKNLSPKIK